MKHNAFINFLSQGMQFFKEENMLVSNTTK